MARLSYGGTVEMDVDAGRDSIVVATRTGGRLAVEVDGEVVLPAIGQPLMVPPVDQQFSIYHMHTCSLSPRTHLHR